MQVDPSSSSSAPPLSTSTDTPAQQTAEELALSHFAVSVLHLLTLWPAVRLALAQGNGFDDSQSALASQIVDLFYTAASSSSSSSAGGAAGVPEGSTSTHEHGVKLPALDELEEVLKWSYGEEFDVDLEDGSEIQVSKDLVALWRECLARVRVEQAGGGAGGVGEEGPMARKFREQAEKVKAKEGPNAGLPEYRIEGEESSDEEDGEDGSSDEEMEGLVEAGPPAPPRERQEPVVDEDGFEMVQPKKKGGRR
ncbi:hypothetical protein JCM8547_002053 [Rhodosporidiobolus lusitaniae]